MSTIATLMQRHPETVRAVLPLTDLERRFLSSGFSGFPVVDGEQLVGVVSRSDVVRSMLVERSRAEQLSDFYSSISSVRPDAGEESFETIAAQVGIRLSELRVKDVMSTTVVTAEFTDSIPQVARLMIEGHLHRLPVVDHGRLIGVLSSMDFVRAAAEGRLADVVDAPISQTLLERGRA